MLIRNIYYGTWTLATESGGNSIHTILLDTDNNNDQYKLLKRLSDSLGWSETGHDFVVNYGLNGSNSVEFYFDKNWQGDVNALEDDFVRMLREMCNAIADHNEFPRGNEDEDWRPYSRDHYERFGSTFDVPARFTINYNEPKDKD